MRNCRNIRSDDKSPVILIVFKHVELGIINVFEIFVKLIKIITKGNYTTLELQHSSNTRVFLVRKFEKTQIKHQTINTNANFNITCTLLYFRWTKRTFQGKISFKQDTIIEITCTT